MRITFVGRFTTFPGVNPRLTIQTSKEDSDTVSVVLLSDESFTIIAGQRCDFEMCDVMMTQTHKREVVHHWDAAEGTYP